MSDVQNGGKAGSQGGTKRPTDWWARVTKLVALLAVILPVAGVVALLIYTRGLTSAFGAATLAALAAGASGLLFGLLFGVPRAVSSGEVRQNAQLSKQVQTANLMSLSPEQLASFNAAHPDVAQSADTAAQKYSPSTNLAEVSDWLTKLLLGAGLVSLTKLGGPLGNLIDSIASGVSSGKAVSGSAQVVAGAIIFGYAAMGFLDGYIITTVWYQRILQNI
jgi:hypothetical protein